MEAQAEPSPFVTKTANKVFASVDKALSHFQKLGYIGEYQLVSSPPRRPRANAADSDKLNHKDNAGFARNSEREKRSRNRERTKTRKRLFVLLIFIFYFRHEDFHAAAAPSFSASAARAASNAAIMVRPLMLSTYRCVLGTLRINP